MLSLAANNISVFEHDPLLFWSCVRPLFENDPLTCWVVLLSLPRRDVWQGVVLAVRVGKMEVGRSGGRGLWLAWSTRNMLNTLKMESFLKQLLSHWMDYQSTGIHKTPLRQHMVLWWKQNRPIATDLEFRAWHHSNCWLDTMLVIECTW